MKVVAAVLAAGRGERFGADKTALLLGGNPVWRWSYDALSAHESVDAVFVVTSADRLASFSSVISANGVIVGGLSRTESSLAALRHAEHMGAEVLLVQDAARPFLSARLISSVLAAIAEVGAAAPAVPVTDTIKEVSSSGVRTLPREHLVAMQTPQGARVDLLRRAHDASVGNATDDMALIEAIGVHPRIVPGDPANFKITLPEDYDRAIALVGGETRTGIGYDVHPFSDDPARPLWIGGVLFPGHVGLEGHSDADVLLHAITDALLGAASLGDIGQHFPPSDARWKNQPSTTFLRHAAVLLSQSGWKIVNVDATCIAETPKIMPRAAEIRAAIAEALAMTVDRISVKATTNERLGSIGRGEGIASFAIATVASYGGDRAASART